MKSFLCSLFVINSITSQLYAQNENIDGLEHMPLNFNKLRVNPYISFMIPYAETKELKLPAVFSIEAQYSLAKIADLRATAHLGSFTGVTIGGMFHMTDKIVNRKTKFVIAETDRKVTYYRVKSERRVAFGPSADLKVGRFDETGLYTRLQAGFEWLTYGHAYYKGYRSSANGYRSVKLQALVANMNNAEYHNGQEVYTNRMGIGAIASLTYVLRPWKRISFYGGLDAGYYVMPGVEDDNATSIKNDKSDFLLDIRLGASIKI